HSSLVLLAHDGTDDPPLATLLAGLEEGLAPAGLVAGLHTGGDAGALARVIAAQRPRAVVLAPPLSADAALVDVCAQADCPVVRLTPEPVDGAALWADERQAAADAAGWLVALGHRRIGFIAGPEDDRRARARELGFIDAMAEQGLERGAEIVAQGDFTLASGEDAARLLLEVSPRPTAILAANDAMAAGALRAIRAAGLDVPGDISVMGLGDIPLAAALAPPLATMALPWRELARLAATRIVNPATPAPPALPARLVPRASVGPAVE
ncbi:MAG TPA: substrate-binding domain-containing protein, partial [Novosphingobium sp.]|nr:substrate-binding domain-containing protein [Novosphingobium sp.]